MRDFLLALVAFEGSHGRSQALAIIPFMPFQAKNVAKVIREKLTNPFHEGRAVSVTAVFIM